MRRLKAVEEEEREYVALPPPWWPLRCARLARRKCSSSSLSCRCWCWLLLPPLLLSSTRWGWWWSLGGGGADDCFFRVRACGCTAVHPCSAILAQALNRRPRLSPATHSHARLRVGACVRACIRYQRKLKEAGARAAGRKKLLRQFEARFENKQEQARLRHGAARRRRRGRVVVVVVVVAAAACCCCCC